MTEQQNWTPESPTETCATTYESLVKALDGLQNKFEIPEAAREFVMRSAATAKDRSTDLHVGVNKVTGAIEEALVSVVSGIADLNRKIVDATYQDAEAAFAAIEKLAGSKTLTEAYQLYVDYLCRQSEVGVARAKSAAGFVSAKGSEGFNTLRDGIVKLMPLRSQAV
jgi:hypothetical protein